MLSAGTGTFTTRLGVGSLDLGVGVNRGDVRIETYAERDFTTVNGSELGDERTVTSRALLTHTLGVATLRAGVTGADIRYAETLTPSAASNYRQKLSSAGMELDVPVGDRTRLAGGVVFDRSTTPETGGRTPGQESLGNPGWRLGAAHDLSPRVRLHASISERSRFPALRELYSGALDRFRPNPDLRPETLLGMEGGFTVDRVIASLPQSTIQVIAFRHRMEDAVVRITLSNPTRFQRINRDRIASAGVELLGGFAFGTYAGRPVTVHGDATLQRIRIFDQTANDQSRRAENNPEQRGRLELGVPLPANLTLLGVARHTGRQYCLNGDTSRLDTLPAKTAGDLAVERSISTGRTGPFRVLKALLSLDNIGNTAVYDQCGLPQPGRTLRVTFSAR